MIIGIDKFRKNKIIILKSTARKSNLIHQKKVSNRLRIREDQEEKEQLGVEDRLDKEDKIEDIEEREE